MPEAAEQQPLTASVHIPNTASHRSRRKTLRTQARRTAYGPQHRGRTLSNTMPDQSRRKTLRVRARAPFTGFGHSVGLGSPSPKPRRHLILSLCVCERPSPALARRGIRSVLPEAATASSFIALCASALHRAENLARVVGPTARAGGLLLFLNPQRVEAKASGAAKQQAEGTPRRARAPFIALKIWHMPVCTCRRWAFFDFFPGRRGRMAAFSGRGLPPQTTAACMAEGQRLKGWPSASFWNTFCSFVNQTFSNLPAAVAFLMHLLHFLHRTVFDMGISSCVLPFTPVVVLPTSGVVFAAALYSPEQFIRRWTFFRCMLSGGLLFNQNTRGVCGASGRAAQAGERACRALSVRGG